MKQISFPTVLAAVAKSIRQLPGGSQRVHGSSGIEAIAKEIKLRTTIKGTDRQVIDLYYTSLSGKEYSHIKNKKQKKAEKAPKPKKLKPSDISSITLPTHFTTEWMPPEGISSYGNPDACPFDLQDVA